MRAHSRVSGRSSKWMHPPWVGRQRLHHMEQACVQRHMLETNILNPRPMMGGGGTAKEAGRLVLSQHTYTLS